MYPTSTQYRLATLSDFDVLRRLDPEAQWGLPTIVAARDGELIGWISVQPDRDDAVVVGPLQARSAIVALRLVDAMEAMLRYIGITRYLFHVASDAPISWREALEHIPGVSYIGTSGSHKWFCRRLCDEQKIDFHA